MTWGWAEITWPETGDDDGQRQAVGQSVVAAEFVDGAQDAWRLTADLSVPPGSSTATSLSRTALPKPTITMFTAALEER